MTAEKPPFSERRVIRLDELHPAARRLVLALIAAAEAESAEKAAGTTAPRGIPK